MKLFGQIFRNGSIFLGFLALVVESVTHGTAGVLIDPIPTFWHTGLIFSACLAAFYTERNYANKNALVQKRAAWASGWAMLISGGYALIFLPMLPLMFIAILFLGAGLLGFSPLALFITTIVQTRLIRRSTSSSAIWIASRRNIAYGALAASVAFFLLQGPPVFTNIAARMATSSELSRQNTGLKLLRSAGLESQVLRMSHRNRWDSRVPWIVGPQQAQTLFYQMTGEPFDTRPAPRRHSWMGRVSTWREWQRPQAGSPFGGSHLKGLYLQSSELDGSISSNGQHAYVEWILTFKNDASFRREARALIEVPPGSVASRLTLWIDDEEREAAYAGSSKVRKAYESVVRRNLDPALLTWKGPNLLNLQVFPIPADGGIMKVKVGLSIPLIERDSYRWLVLPRIQEANFGVDPHVVETAWVESNTDLWALEPWNSESSSDQLRALRVNREVVTPRLPPIRVPVAESSKDEKWILDTPGGLFSVQRKGSADPPKGIVLVVDGSSPMANFRSRMQELVNAIPQETSVAVWIAKDEPERWDVRMSPLDTLHRRSLVKWLKGQEFRWGHDPVPALTLAYEFAAAREDTLVLWVHAGQPIKLSQPSALHQRLRRRSDGPVIFSLALKSGPNRLLTDDLARQGILLPVPVIDDPIFDLRAFLANGHHLGEWKLNSIRTQGTEKKASKNFNRIMFNWWVEGLQRQQNEEMREPAMAKASEMRLVTPWTGAVVLENKAQYRASGLEPASSTSVPSIPEPTQILLGLVAAAYSARAARRRRKQS